MKFYLTVEPVSKIKNVFVNLSAFYILDIKAIIEGLKLNMNKPSNVYFANNYISELIETQAKSKRLQGIIYINSNLNVPIIDSIYNHIKDLPTIEGMVLMDDGFNPKLKEYHRLFEEVLFFPTVKRVKILECKPFSIGDLSAKDAED